MDDWRKDRVGAALNGENPMVMARMRTGFACIGDHRLMPGYSVLLTDDPDIDHLTDLELPTRVAFLTDMALLGQAIKTACKGRGLRRNEL